jgi:hypothetical protein
VPTDDLTVKEHLKVSMLRELENKMETVSYTMPKRVVVFR